MTHDELFDYAPFLLRVDNLARALHEACLHKQYTDIPSMCDALVVQSRMLRAWAHDQQEKVDGSNN